MPSRKSIYIGIIYDTPENKDVASALIKHQKDKLGINTHEIVTKALVLFNNQFDEKGNRL